MDIKRYCYLILLEMGKLPHDRQLSYLHERLQEIEDGEERKIAETLIGFGLEIGMSVLSSAQVIVLIHGIRTQATWQEKIRQELEKLEGVRVYPIGYGYLDAFRFWFPFFFRTVPIKKVLRELRTIRTEHRNDKISVIAHSFGTYAIKEILSKESDVELHHLILCGSIIPTTVQWDMLPKYPKGQVINECGTKDIWPVLAKCASWGYGPSGTFGFKTAKITDRYHDAAHSDFFSGQFVRKYWVPLIADGRIVPSAWGARRPSPGWLLSVLGILSPGWLMLLISTLIMVCTWVFGDGISPEKILELLSARMPEYKAVLYRGD
jgi:pimeloyl-ACP methyl ester carboxylesterase